MFSFKRILIGSTGLAMIVGGAVAAGPAHAGTNASTCTVNGQVAISDPNEAGGGLDNDETGTNPTNNFSFSQTSLSCTSANAALNGTFSNVHAAGGTTGIAPGTAENCGAGQSNGAFGITATAPDGTSAAGSATFIRVGSHVHVSGTISDATDGISLNFVAELEFAPALGQVCANDLGGGLGEVTSATVSGDATLQDVH